MTIHDVRAAFPVNPGDLVPGVQAVQGDVALRAMIVAGVAGVNADEVDRDARFPAEAIAAAKAQGLLGLQIPLHLGGEGAALGEVAEVCYTLGRACASTAMIFAMHQTKVACIVRHCGASGWHAGVLRRVAEEQLLLASSTTEGQNGGNIRQSSAAVDTDGAEISLERAATVISYGAQADGIVTTARRGADAAKSDQVLLVLLKEQYSLDRLNGWETLGMRGTCSSGFKLLAHGAAEQILPDRYETIHAETMTPVSHLLWSSAWAGIAAGAVERAQAFTRHAARHAAGQMPPGAVHYGRAVSSLRSLRSLIASALDLYGRATTDRAVMGSIDFQSTITMLKVEASELAVQTVMSAMRACGLSGYRQDGEFSVSRQLRDILSSPIMIHNDRIVANGAGAALMAAVPAKLRG